MAPLVFDETWRQFRLLSMLVIAAMVGSSMLPALRPYRRRVLGGLLLAYLIGGAVVLGRRYLGG